MKKFPSFLFSFVSFLPRSNRKMYAVRIGCEWKFDRIFITKFFFLISVVIESWNWLNFEEEKLWNINQLKVWQNDCSSFSRYRSGLLLHSTVDSTTEILQICWPNSFGAVFRSARTCTLLPRKRWRRFDRDTFLWRYNEENLNIMNDISQI